MKLRPAGLLFICLFCVFQAVSQSRQLDSLRTALKTDHSDTSQFKTLMKMGQLFNLIIPDSARPFFLTAKAIAERNGNELDVCRAWIGYGWCRFLTGDLDTAFSTFNYVAKVSQKYIPGKEPATIRKAKQVYAAALSDLAAIYRSRDESGMATDLYLKALALNKETNSKESIIRNLGSLGNLYAEAGNYNKAYEYFFACLKLAEASGDRNNEAITLSCIASVYLYQNNNEQALEYSFRALKLTEELGHKQNLSPILNNIAIIYDNMHDPATAEKYYLKAYATNVETGNKYGQSLNLGNIGQLYIEKKEYEKATEYLLKGLKLARETDDKIGASMKLSKLGFICSKTNRFKEAEKFSLEALKLAEETDAITAKKDANYYLSLLYEDNKQPALALKYYKIFIGYRDSLFNEENTKKTVQQQMQFDFDKKQTADSLKVAEERKVNNLKFEQEKTKRYSLYGGFILVIIFTIFIYNRFRIIRKQKQIIELKEQETHKQNQVISHQKELVEAKQKEILDSMAYARRIQNALITSENYIEKELRRLQKRNG